jgi:hypothetical protein
MREALRGLALELQVASLELQVAPFNLSGVVLPLLERDPSLPGY